MCSVANSGAVFDCPLSLLNKELNIIIQKSFSVSYSGILSMVVYFSPDQRYKSENDSSNNKNI